MPGRTIVTATRYPRLTSTTRARLRYSHRARELFGKARLCCPTLLQFVRRRHRRLDFLPAATRPRETKRTADVDRPGSVCSNTEVFWVGGLALAQHQPHSSYPDKRTRLGGSGW